MDKVTDKKNIVKSITQYANKMGGYAAAKDIEKLARVIKTVASYHPPERIHTPKADPTVKELRRRFRMVNLPDKESKNN